MTVTRVKRFGFAAIALLIVGVVLFGTLGGCRRAAPAPTTTTTTVPPIELKWAESQAEASLYGQMAAWYATEIEKRTAGRVKIRVFYSETLLKSGEMLPAVKSGAVDIADMVSAFFPADLPLDKVVIGGWGLGMTPEVTQKVWQALYARVPALNEELTRQNIKLLYRNMSPPWVLISKKPVEKVADLNGMKLRVVGSPWLAGVLTKAGVVAVSILPGEVYEALQRGAVDGVFLDEANIVSWKLYESAKYVSMGEYAGTPVVLGPYINMERWRSFPSDIQAIFTATAADAVKEHLKMVQSYQKSAMATLTQNGVTYAKFPASEWAALVALSPDDNWTAWLKEQEAAGRGDAARQIIQVWKEAIAAK